MHSSLVPTSHTAQTPRGHGATARIAGLAVALAATSTMLLTPDASAAATNTAAKQPAGPAAATPKCEHYDWGLKDFAEVRCSTLPPGTSEYRVVIRYRSTPDRPISVSLGPWVHKGQVSSAHSPHPKITYSADFR